MLAGFCLLLFVVVAAVGRWIPYFWLLWLLLVTGYGNSNSNILLLGLRNE